jgi:hypothetical protein
MTIYAAALLTLLLQAPTIQGIVVKPAGDPLSKAVVELRSNEDDTIVLQSQTTEDNGTFSFANIRPGRYRLTVNRRGYVRPPLTVTVAAGQPLTPLRLSMSLAGAIYGRIFVAEGEPLGNIEVQALKASYPEGRRVLTVAETVLTNDLGEYRLFWLEPGRYFVAARHPKAQTPYRRMFNTGGLTLTTGGPNPRLFMSSANTDPLLNAFEPGPEPEAERYVPIYFGGTADPDAASGIDVRAGTEFGGANIAITTVAARRVRGFVLDGATGKPAQNAGLTDLKREREFSRAGEIQVNPETGAYDVLLLPGTHTLVASAVNASGYASVKVGNTDIDNLNIVMLPTFDIDGAISVEGHTGDNPAFNDFRVTLRYYPPREDLVMSSYSIPRPNGSFRLAASTGDFRLNLQPVLNIAPPAFGPKLPASLQNAYVKSIRLGEADVLNGVLRLERPPSAPLEIVIGTNPGALEGQIARGNQRPLADVWLVLIPNVRFRSELYRTVITDPFGRFTFDRVPPGDYKILALEEVENGAWFDPEFIKAYENAGIAVRIVEGRRETVRVPVIER